MTANTYYLIAPRDSIGDTADGPYSFDEARRRQDESKATKQMISADQLAKLRQPYSPPAPLEH